MVVKLSDISSKTGKSAFFVFLGHFLVYIGQPHDHIGCIVIVIVYVFQITVLHVIDSYFKDPTFSNIQDSCTICAKELDRSCLDGIRTRCRGLIDCRQLELCMYLNVII